MNNDMPWVIGLTDEEVQELRSKKQELTQYGKDKIRQLMMNQEPYPDEMFEEAAKREAENKALEIAKQGIEQYKPALKELAEMTREERITANMDGGVGGSWKVHTMSRFEKNPDEIVLEDVKMFHYETMEEGRHVWIGIYTNDGKIYHMNIGGDNLKVYFSNESCEP